MDIRVYLNARPYFVGKDKVLVKVTFSEADSDEEIHTDEHDYLVKVGGECHLRTRERATNFGISAALKMVERIESINRGRSFELYLPSGDKSEIVSTMNKIMNKLLINSTAE